MGDRALVQFVTKDNGKPFESGPVVYLHWHGGDVKQLLQETCDLMVGRASDVSYTTARFIGVCHLHTPGNMSLGVWNQHSVITGKDTHGDAGCFIVDVTKAVWEVATIGGYGFASGDEDYDPKRRCSHTMPPSEEAKRATAD